MDPFAWWFSLGLLGVVCLLWVINRKRHFSVLKRLGIPGPPPSLLFGNLLEILRKTPLKCHGEWIKKYGKVVGYYFGETPIVLIADVDILKRIQVSDFQKFMNRPDITRNTRPPQKSNNQAKSKSDEYSNQLVTLRDKRWKEIRSIITPSFTASKMKMMAPVMQNAIDSLVAHIGEKGNQPFDIYALYQGLTMDVVGRAAFGISTNVQNDPDDKFLRTAKLLLPSDIQSTLLLFAASFRGLQKFWNELGKFRLRFKNKGGGNPVKELISSVRDVVAARRKNPQNRRPDLLQMMLDAERTDDPTLASEQLTATDDKDSSEKQQEAPSSSDKNTRKMTDSDIVDNSVVLFLAGYETTSTTLAFTTHFLVQHQEAQERIRQEVLQLLREEGELDYYSLTKLPYLDQVLQESLRLYPPVYLFVSRECGEDVDFGSFKISKGLAVQTAIYNVQRDPELWNDPEEFRPERWTPENKSRINPMAFQAFGNGPRNCIGMRFAQMEIKLALARILSQFRLEPCESTQKEPTLKISPVTLTPRNGIWLKAVQV